MPLNNKNIPGSPQDWLARAQGDLALATVNLPEGGFYEDLCFHAQQAAEKAVKAVYLSLEWTFRYVHDLDELLSGLKDRGFHVPPEVQEAKVLSLFAWESRYPGLSEPVTYEEYQEAISQAKHVVNWAREIIEKHKT